MIIKRALVSSLLSSLLTSALALGISSPRLTYAQVNLPPGTTTGISIPIISTGTPPFGGTLIQEINSTIFGTNTLNTISGTVSSAVFRSPLGFLDFAYQFRFDATTNVVLDAVSLSSFKNVSGLLIAQTSADIDGVAGLPAEAAGGTIQNFFSPASTTGSYSSASRPNVNGDGINSTLLTGVTGGEASYTFLIRTQATGFSVGGSASVQGGGISAFTPAHGALVPLVASAPEPGSLTLIVLGSLMIVSGRRRQ